MIALQPSSQARVQSTEFIDSVDPDAVLEPFNEPKSSAQWLLRQAQEPLAMREWASALRRPVETVLEEVILREPERMARMLAPALDHAYAQRKAANRAQTFESAWRWFSSLTTPRVWGWTLQALWQGDAPWSYIEERAMWYEIVEVALFDPRNGMLLAKAESPTRARLRNAPALESIPFLGTASASVHRPLAESESASASVDCSQVVVLIGDRCRMAVRVTGQPPLSLRSRLQNICLEAESLIERTGSTLPAVRQLLEKIAQRALISEGPNSAHWAAKHSLALISLSLLLVSGLLTWVGVREYRWQTFLGLLRQSSGVHILREDSSWGQTRIEGLCEANTPDPVELALAMGIDLRHVDLKFTGPESTTFNLAQAQNLSAKIVAAATPEKSESKPIATIKTSEKPKPALVAIAEPAAPHPISTSLRALAPEPAGLPEVTASGSDAPSNEPTASYHSVETVRALLRLPDSLRLSLKGSKLTATGALPEPDYTRLLDAPQRFAWIVEVDMSNVEDLTGDEIKGLLRAITATQIVFKPQSEAFEERTQGTIGLLAKDIQDLVTLAALKHQYPHLGIQAVGKEIEADSPIIDSRKAALQLALMRNGVQPECFETSTSATTSQTPPPTPANSTSDGLVLSVTLSSTSR